MPSGLSPRTSFFCLVTRRDRLRAVGEERLLRDDVQKVVSRNLDGLDIDGRLETVVGCALRHRKRHASPRELAQAFCRLGSPVVIAHNDPMFLPKEERDAAQVLLDAMARHGVEIHLSTTVVAVRMVDGKKVADLVGDDNKISVSVDEILTGIGPTPNVESLNLGAAGVKYDAETGVFVNDFLQTSNARIYAAGDVSLEHKFTHAADAYNRTRLTPTLKALARRWLAW